jgi:hypothetical protein
VGALVVELGAAVCATVGATVGAMDGAMDGRCVGEFVIPDVGEGVVGPEVGATVGCALGVGIGSSPNTVVTSFWLSARAQTLNSSMMIAPPVAPPVLPIAKLFVAPVRVVLGRAENSGGDTPAVAFLYDLCVMPSHV